MKPCSHLSKGSFTVEAACLMPLILLIIFGVLTFFFHVHNRAWLTAAAYESAVSGSIAGASGEAAAYADASLKSHILGNTGFFSSENLSCNTSVGGIVKVTYSLNTVSSFGNFCWPITVQGEAPILHPVFWIRSLKSGVQVLRAG